MVMKENIEEDHSSEEIDEEMIIELESQAKKELSVKELEQQLQEAIDAEDYERASKLRDEINKRQK